MTGPVKGNEGPWNTFQDIVGMNEGLETDLRELHRRLLELDGFYEQIYERYCDSLGWYLVEGRIARSLPDPEVLLDVIPPDYRWE